MMLKQYWRMGAIGLLIVLIWLGMIPLRLVIAARQVPKPEAILVLGGGLQREETAAQLAKYYPNLPVWVSSGKVPEDAYPIFQAAGVALERVHLDYQATDTVTNFTTLIPQFQQQGIRHLYLVTSDFHMARSTAIAGIVLGYHGIAFTPVSVSSNEPDESWLRIVRDSGRAILWLITGRTGANMARCISPESVVDVQNCKFPNRGFFL
jgi:uncharacterized SAM-binding protein YcdF (DUF218 family)